MDRKDFFREAELRILNYDQNRIKANPLKKRTKQSGFFYLFFLLLILFSQLSLIANAQERKISVAVIELRAGDGIEESVSGMLSDYLRAHLYFSEKYNVISKTRMEQVFAENQFSIAEETEKDSIVQSGNLLGAEKVFYGSIKKIKGFYYITVKTVNIESRSIEDMEAEICPEYSEDLFLASMSNIAIKIAGEVKLPEEEIEKAIAIKTQESEKIEKTGFRGGFGLGVNWLGLHVKYGITDRLLVQGKVQFDPANTVVGGRLCYVFHRIPGNVPILLYTGGEFIWSFSQYLLGGYETGGFAGTEFLVTKNIGLGADIGLYYVNIWSILGGIDDMGIIVNVDLTYYF